MLCFAILKRLEGGQAKRFTAKLAKNAKENQNLPFLAGLKFKKSRQNLTLSAPKEDEIYEL
jgi:hypothetical protein